MHHRQLVQVLSKFTVGRMFSVASPNIPSNRQLIFLDKTLSKTPMKLGIRMGLFVGLSGLLPILHSLNYATGYILFGGALAASMVIQTIFLNRYYKSSVYRVMIDDDNRLFITIVEKTWPRVALREIEVDRNTLEVVYLPEADPTENSTIPQQFIFTINFQSVTGQEFKDKNVSMVQDKNRFVNYLLLSKFLD